MDNKIVIVTGANNGIGFETTKNLLLRGKQCSLLNVLVSSSSNAVFFLFNVHLLHVDIIHAVSLTPLWMKSYTLELLNFTR